MDDETVVLPVTVDRVSVTAEGRNMILQTNNGLKVLFDGDAHVLMSIPSPFRGRICGLCGNFNGNWSDDFVLPDGALAPSAEAFGEAWRAPGSSPECGEGCGDQGCPVCLAEETKEYEKNEACGKMQDPQGPFAACHQVLSPLEYFRQCVYDLCAHKGNKTYLCQSLAAYTTACQAAGATVQPWRTEHFCRECLGTPLGTFWAMEKSLPVTGPPPALPQHSLWLSPSTSDQGVSDSSQEFTLPRPHTLLFPGPVSASCSDLEGSWMD